MIAPQQSRSRATEERILAATERLLAIASFEDLPVVRIAAEAGVSVGGVYARFADKSELLKALHRRYEDYRTEYLREAFHPAMWENAALAQRVHGICAALVALFSDRRAVLRSFLLRYWSQPEDADGPFKARLESVYGGAVALLLGCRAEIEASDPERAARMALALVAGACRDIVVMKPPHAPGAVEVGEGELIDALANAALGVLRCQWGDKT